MIELVQSISSLAWNVMISLFNIVLVLFSGVWDVLLTLHMEAPFLEGLLVGIGLAWLMSHQEKNVVIKALAIPLVLSLEILDLVWIRCIDLIRELWLTACNAASWAIDKVLGWLKAGRDITVYFLRGIKEKLKKRDTKSEE